MNGLITMLNQLESHRLEVMLVPLNPNRRGWNEGGCRRCLADQNAKWYRDFCARFPSSRGTRKGGFDTVIRRANVLSALNRLVSGAGYGGKYRDELVAVAKKIT